MKLSEMRVKLRPQARVTAPPDKLGVKWNRGKVTDAEFRNLMWLASTATLDRASMAKFVTMFRDIYHFALLPKWQREVAERVVKGKDVAVLWRHIQDAEHAREIEAELEKVGYYVLGVTRPADRHKSGAILMVQR